MLFTCYLDLFLVTTTNNNVALSSRLVDLSSFQSSIFRRFELCNARSFGNLLLSSTSNNCYLQFECLCSSNNNQPINQTMHSCHHNNNKQNNNTRSSRSNVSNVCVLIQRLRSDPVRSYEALTLYLFTKHPRALLLSAIATTTLSSLAHGTFYIVC